VTYFVSQGNTDSSSRYVGDVGEHVFNGDNALKNYRSLTHYTCIQNAASPCPTKYYTRRRHAVWKTVGTHRFICAHGILHRIAECDLKIPR
jgi:hypothetical protein